jgi:tellurite resistance protein
MRNNELSTKANESLRLRNYPITFFAIALGLAGFSLAVQKLAGTRGSGMLPALEMAATILVYVAVGVFALVALIYVAKAIRYPKEFVSEFNHPVKINFFPLIAKILLVLSIIYLDRDMTISYYLWLVGAALQLTASIVIISFWIGRTDFTIEHMTPAWFIPIVGSLMVPIAGVPHGFIEVSWFFFAIGLAFWMILFAIAMYRLIFHPPISDRLMSTLFILFAPPAIAFIAYAKLAGLLELGNGPDVFARLLYYISLFLFILILFRIQALARIKFFLSWWAYSFPLAAQALATVLMLHVTHHAFYRYLALFEVGLLALVIVVLVVLTVHAASKAEICVEE